jgi:hypothetical protein
MKIWLTLTAASTALRQRQGTAMKIWLAVTAVSAQLRQQ